MTIHGFSVALNSGIDTPVAASRAGAREIHINPWASGTKGFGPLATVGDSSVTATTGLVLSSARSVAMSNAPFELVLGDTEAMPIININEIFGTTPSSVQLSGFYIP